MKGLGRGVRKVGVVVPRPEAERRALAWLVAHSHPDRLYPPSWVGLHGVWPDSRLRPQGAAFAVSPILAALRRQGLAEWVDVREGMYRSWGWRATRKGREHVANRTSE